MANAIRGSAGTNHSNKAAAISVNWAILACVLWSRVAGVGAGPGRGIWQWGGVILEGQNTARCHFSVVKLD